jgi:NAD-dependent deacetylase
MNPFDLKEKIKRSIELINGSRYFVVFTGAGISTPSGIPDFRGEKEGLWQRYDALQVASHTAFVKTPAVFYDWFRPLFVTSWTAKPNPAHVALADLEKEGIVRSIITQNIDGLHQKAGSRVVHELHGSALTFRCPSCKLDHSAGYVYEQFASGNLIPFCQKCGAILKPDVVLFEEPLPGNIWIEAEKEAAKADLLLVVGSSLEVYPACTIPQKSTNHGCRLIINNFSPTPLDAIAEVLIPMDAAEYLPLINNSFPRK